MRPDGQGLNSIITPAEYEQLIADVCKLAASGILSIPGAVVEQRQKLRGKSGQLHEIDVVVDVQFSGVRFLTLIECKAWQRPVGVEEVMVLKQRVDDIGAHKGIVVSHNGFQQGAVTFAKPNGIALVIVEARRNATRTTVIAPYVVSPRKMPMPSVITPNLRHGDETEPSPLQFILDKLFPSTFLYSVVTEDSKGPIALTLLCNPLVARVLMTLVDKNNPDRDKLLARAAAARTLTGDPSEQNE